MQALSVVKKTVFLILLAFIFLVGSWGVVFASAFNLLSISPKEGSLLNVNKPTIKIKKLAIPGSWIENVQLEIDNQPVAIKTKTTKHQVLIALPKPLADGKHNLKAIISYNFIFNRKLSYRWHITVDTKPPNIALANQETFLVTPKDEISINGRSENGALIEVKLNQKIINPGLKVKKDGYFSIYLNQFERKNQLVLKATDKAGNSQSLAVVLIKDKIAPEIKAIQPGDGETVRFEPKITVSFNEADTGLKIINLFINSVLAVAKGDDKSLAVTYSGILLKDGQHKAKVVAVDYAGNKVEKEWHFNVDTRRIVVNRPQRRLYFYQGGILKLVFPVAVGMPQYPTPAGNWRIVRKEINPVWRNPGSDWAKEMPKIIPPGPTNPLGLRALALNAPGILIHGTSDNASIGRAASHGCVRMRNNDIINFYPLVGIGVPVQIY